MITRNAIDIARDFIAHWEGFRSDAYLCPASVWTIGFGTTKGVNPGDTVTKEEAYALLERDMTEAIQCVDTNVDADLDDEQVAALVSFVYNVGCGAFKSSTMLKMLNSGNIDGAEKEFGRWNKANGKVLSGLTNRREDERKLFSGELA